MSHDPGRDVRRVARGLVLRRRSSWEILARGFETDVLEIRAPPPGRR
ncbi:hypothetical protein [Streptomyces olivaceus]|nr:hypothetical protein [Streptomyces olivaceus]WFB88315.1 hypothetical protein MMU79_36250 [Streptomyces olivaceus]